MGTSLLVSLTSKCRCGPPELPLLPDKAIRSPLATGSLPGSGYMSTSNDLSRYCTSSVYCMMSGDDCCR